MQSNVLRPYYLCWHHLKHHLVIGALVVVTSILINHTEKRDMVFLFVGLGAHHNKVVVGECWVDVCHRPIVFLLNSFTDVKRYWVTIVELLPHVEEMVGERTVVMLCRVVRTPLDRYCLHEVRVERPIVIGFGLGKVVTDVVI